MFFKKNPKEKLQKEMVKKLEEARNWQRQGNIIQYAELMTEAEEIGKKIDALSNQTLGR